MRHMGLVGGYMRVSRKGDRDPDQWLTIPLQQKSIEDHCHEHGDQLADLRKDIDVSGGDDNRSNLEALVAKIEAGELSGLVVAKLDRFSRDLSYGARVIRRIEEAGGFFVAAADGVRVSSSDTDATSDEARLQLNMMLAIADYELRRFRTGWKRVRERHVIERGRHWGAWVPFGYTRAEDGKLEPHPDWAPVVTELFQRRALGESASDLARWLHHLGARTARGGEPTHRWVRGLLTQRVYLGEAHAGVLVHPGAHEALVDRGTWEQAQSAAGPAPSRSNDAPVLGGLIRCWACRGTLTAAQSPYADGKRRCYRCRGRRAAGVCPRPAFVMEEHLKPLVEVAFWSIIGGDIRATTRPETDADHVVELQDARDRAERDLVAYRDTPEISSVLDPLIFADGLRVRQSRLDEASRRLAAELGRRPSIDHDVASLQEAWPTMDNRTKRRMLVAAIGTVVVKAPVKRRDHSEPLGSRCKVLLPDDLPSDLPRSGGRPDSIVSFPSFNDPATPWISLM
jgi:DNA invertase Pin-like site-specific DNA recombinase